MGGFRVLLAAAVLLAPVLAGFGCSLAPDMTVVHSMASGNKTVVALESFRVKTAVKARDGGSIFVFGELADATALSLKLDNGIHSATKGQLFIQMKPQTEAIPEEMRRVTEAEAAILIPPLERASGQNIEDTNPEYLKAILDALRNLEDL
ncbi:MAG: hypothetical protein ACK42I_08450 [Thermomicrobium sp.]